MLIKQVKIEPFFDKEGVDFEDVENVISEVRSYVEKGELSKAFLVFFETLFEAFSVEDVPMAGGWVFWKVADENEEVSHKWQNLKLSDDVGEKIVNVLKDTSYGERQIYPFRYKEEVLLSYFETDVASSLRNAVSVLSLIDLLFDEVVRAKGKKEFEVREVLLHILDGIKYVYKSVNQVNNLGLPKIFDEIDKVIGAGGGSVKEKTISYLENALVKSALKIEFLRAVKPCTDFLFGKTREENAEDSAVEDLDLWYSFIDNYVIKYIGIFE